eukprot:TRINITY_DN26063_c0_g1_i2.p1 TRINITY_DN26063_c0_g1~~TRINITY_DN26063_c0_g1_i2.p1  ORF type:complete len:436 (+),score=124.91 TRINITY_DN26063_c0_g1_i2:153-1460(+)
MQRLQRSNSPAGGLQSRSWSGEPAAGGDEPAEPRPCPVALRIAAAAASLLAMCWAAWPLLGGGAERCAPAGAGTAAAHHAGRREGMARGVILFLDSERKPILGKPSRTRGRSALKVLQRSFLSCWPYPVHIFKENATEEWITKVRALTTSTVTFTEVRHVFDAPPGKVHNDTTTYWIEVLARGAGHHLGYRLMCRFFAGVFAEDPKLRDYDYYWRLDTDSWVGVDQPLRVDPFAVMHDRGCRYGFPDSPQQDGPTVTKGLLQTALDWSEAVGMPAQNLSRLRGVVRSMGGRLPMYYNNFELASFAFLRSPLYRSYFSFLDGTDGFLKHRWGDAPVRTLAVLLMLSEGETCSFRGLVPYRHANYADPAEQAQRLGRPSCPSGARPAPAAAVPAAPACSPSGFSPLAPAGAAASVALAAAALRARPQPRPVGRLTPL